MVPNAAAIYLTGILLSMVWYWNDYYISSMLMDQDVYKRQGLHQLMIRE